MSRFRPTDLERSLLLSVLLLPDLFINCSDGGKEEKVVVSHVDGGNNIASSHLVYSVTLLLL